MRLLVLFLLGIAAQGICAAPNLAKVVPVGDGKIASISLVAQKDDMIVAPASTMKPQQEKKTAAVAAPAEKASQQVAAAVKADAPATAVKAATSAASKTSSHAASPVAASTAAAKSSHADAQVELSVGSGTAVSAGADSKLGRWRFYFGRRRGSRRARRRAWIRMRYSTRCPRGDEGRACRAIRIAAWRMYLRARRAYMLLHWKLFGKHVARKCRGPWTSKCPAGEEGRPCRHQRRRWRKRCRRAAFSRRRRSCRGPWIRSCPSGKTAAARRCRRTRRSWRKACRARRGYRNRRRGARGAIDRIARFAARLLASRSSYLVRNRQVRLIYIGNNKVLEWRPRTGSFQIFKVRRRSMNRVSSRPLWRKRERVCFGRWTKLTRPYRLIYVGRKRLLAHNKRTGKYRIYKINHNVVGNANPLKLQSKGRWRRARRRSLIYVGRGQLLTYRRKSGRYALWKVNTKKTGKNKRVFKRLTKNSSALLKRRKAKYAYIGKNVILQWHKKKYRMIHIRRKAIGKQRALKFLKKGNMNTALKRKFPLRAGHPGVGLVYLGGRLLVVYRTKSSRQKRADGKPLRRLALFPLRVTVLNNPKFNPANAAVPYLTGSPSSKAYKPWLTNPRYCVSYKTWAPKGKVVFTTHNKIAKLHGAAGRSNRIVRLGRILLDWSPSTGSYRMLRYSRRSKRFAQVSFGVFPGFKANWAIVALGRKRLLNFNPSTRQFVLYPVDGYRIRRPIAKGTLPVPRGFKFIPFGSKHLLAWNPSNGQWRVYKVNADVTGVRSSPLRQMIAGGQWCDIKAGTTVVALGGRNVFTIDKRSGSYSLYRFNKWAKGRRANVFKKVLARGIWADPFLNSRTRIVALRGSRLLGWQPTRDGALYTTWTLGYSAVSSSGIGSVSYELRKLVSTLRNVKRSIQLKGRNVDPTMALLQKPNFAGMKYDDLKRMFSAYLSDVKVRFPWKTTLEYFRNKQKARARGMATAAPERSDGARASRYALSPSRAANPWSESAPVPAPEDRRRTSGAPSSSSLNNNSNAPGRNEANPVSRSSLPDGVNREVWPDGSSLKEDVFDDGTGPVKGSTGPASVNPLSGMDLLAQQIQDPVFPLQNPRVAYPDIQWTNRVNDVSTLDDDDAMSVGDQSSKGLTKLERQVPGLEFSAPSKRTTSAMDGAALINPYDGSATPSDRLSEKEDPVGDRPRFTVYPPGTRDYVGRRDRLRGMIVPGDGEPPIQVVH